MDIDPDQVVSQTEPLRRLARGILFDPARADDVVQDAWLVALRKYRRPRASWLRGVVRTLARSANRDEARRKRRERMAAAEERLPSALDTAARIEVLKSLVDALGSLEEPYRETILLRFFDQLPPRKIAKLLGVPVETVQTRLGRGLRRMRRRLDARHGDQREAFLGALLPLAGRTPLRLGLSVPTAFRFPLTGPGAIAMSKTLPLAAATLGAVLVAGLAYRLQRARPEPEAAVPPATMAPTVARSTATEGDGSSSGRSPISHARSDPGSAPRSIDATVALEAPAEALEAMKPLLLDAFEASLLGVMEPEVFLKAALALAQLGIDPVAVPEPDLSGAIRFPILGTPPGMTAELQIARSRNPKFSDVMSIRFSIDPPRDPYIVEGASRLAPEAYVTVWRDGQGSVMNFAVLSSLPVGGGSALGLQLDAGVIPSSLLYSMDIQDPSRSTAKVGGFENGSPAALDRPTRLGAEPSSTDIDKLGSYLDGMYEKAKSRD